MRINHNNAALNTWRQLTNNEVNSQKSLEKLSSGLRINKAGDDAAGLAISEKMRAQIRGLDQAGRNAQDGISLIQTAEGNLSETQSILQRMRELATQAANDTNVSVDRDEIQKEVNQLTSEINRIGNTTEFNTQKLLKGKDVAVVASAQNVATTTAGIAGVPVGDTSALAINAKSVIAIASHASLQGNTAAATGTVGLTDQTTVSVKGKDSSTIVTGLTFTSTTLSSAVPNGGTIQINQLAGLSSANTVTVTGTGSNAIINFNIGTDAAGKSLFTGTNRGELANFLTGIAGGVGYAGSGVTITVPEDPNANGPASAEKLVNMPDNTQVATASTIYSGTLDEGVTEVRGVSTFSVTNAIKEAGDTITVGGKAFTAVTTGANAAKGEFNISQTNAWLKAGAVINATQDLSGVTNSNIAVTVGGTAYTVSSASLAAFGNGATNNRTTDDVVNLLKNAINGSVKLSDVADVSLGSDNKIQIIAKKGGDLTGANDISITVTNGGDAKGATITALTGLTAETSTANGANGAATGATAADQARSLRVAMNADTTVGAHYTASGTLNAAEVLVTENATKATGVSLASVTIAGGGMNNKLNITDLSGKNLSQVTIVKGTGLAITGAQANTNKLDTSLQLTSGTKSTELNGVKVSFAGLAAGATGTTTSILTTSWDAANQTLTVTGAVGDAESAANFKNDLQAVLRTGLSAAGFTGAAGLTVAAGATASTAGNNQIALALNGNSLTFGVGNVNSTTLDTSFKTTSAVAGTEFEGVKIAFAGLASAGATALSSTWDAATKTLNVTGTVLAAETAANFATAVQTLIRTDLAAAGFSVAGSTALTVAAGASGTAATIMTQFNANSITLTNGGGATAIAAHAMAVDQQNGNLTITLSDDTPNNNTAAKIQAAVQTIGLVKASAGDVDFTKYQFTAEGEWDAKEVGEDITKANTTLVGGTKEVKGDYSFDITKAFDVGDKVVIKGQTFTAVASGAIGSKNEFDVAGGNIANQAISLRNAIGLNSTLSAIYTVGGIGSTVDLKEITATGTDMKTTDLAVRATGTAGEYAVNVGLLENGAAFVLDGKDIMVSAKNANVGYDQGTAIKVTDDVAAQTAELADAINKNADLKVKYTASVGSDGSLVIKQNELQESSTAPTVATKNSSIGEFTASLQIGANAGQSMTVDVNDMRSAALSVSGDGSVGTVAAKDGKVASYVSVANVTDGTNNTAVEFALDVSSASKASASISVLNDAIESVSSERAKLGAFQNRLEHTISNLGTSSENMTSAESRIRDVDMAKEMMEFTKNNILNQAATAMLAQANQAPQGILQLLR